MHIYVIASQINHLKLNIFYFTKSLVLLFLLASLLGSSCITSKKMVKESIVLDTLHVNANSETYTYRATESLTWKIDYEEVALSFNFKERTANGNVLIKCHPYFYNTDSLVLDAKTMKINSVALAQPKISSLTDVIIFDTSNYKQQQLKFNYHNNKLYIYLDRPYTAKENLTILISYVAEPYSEPIGGSAAISQDRGLYFINTDNLIVGKPVQIWTQGETESNSHWMPTIDKPNVKFLAKIQLTVPDTLVTLSNGYLKRTESNKNGLRTDIWSIDWPIQPYALMFAIGKFTIVKDSYKGKSVDYYVEDSYAPFARAIFKNTPQMMAFFSEITGVDFPWNKYCHVIVRDYVSGAMENTSATLYGEFMNQNFREIEDKSNEDVVSHELFHQWFGDYVTAESWSNLTLNESFANFGEQLWKEQQYGKTAAEKLADDDLQQYLNAAIYNDPALLRYYYNDKEQMFDRTTYQKGGAILRYLRCLIGNEAFSEAMRTYLKANADKCAEVANWRMAVEEVTGQDWNWFFNQWYLRGGHPELFFKYTYDDSSKMLLVNVKQIQSDSSFMYSLPLRMLLCYDKDTISVFETISKKKEAFKYSYKNGVKPFLIPDADHVLPGKISENKNSADFLKQFIYSNDYISSKRCLQLKNKDFSDSNYNAIVNLSLNAIDANLREIGTRALLGVKDTNIKKQFINRLQNIAVKDVNHNVRVAAIQVLGYWHNKSSQSLLQQCLYDSSYFVAGAALAALYNLDSMDAYERALLQLLFNEPKSSLQSAIWTCIGKIAQPNDVTLFQTSFKGNLLSAERTNILNGLYYYLIRVNDTVSFKLAISFLGNIIQSENVSDYRINRFSYLINAATNLKAISDDKSNINAIAQNIAIIKYTFLNSQIKNIINSEKDIETKKQMNKMLKELD